MKWVPLQIGEEDEVFFLSFFLLAKQWDKKKRFGVWTNTNKNEEADIIPKSIFPLL
jgi:hypothetical protein